MAATIMRMSSVNVGVFVAGAVPLDRRMPAIAARTIDTLHGDS